MAKKKFLGIQQVKHPETIRRLCGVSRDKNGLYIGKYVYLSTEADQVFLEELCTSWLETYKQDNSFYLTIDLECLAPDTLVTTETGDIIELVEAGGSGKILGCSSSTPKTAPVGHFVEAFDLVNKGTKDCLKVITKYGLPTISSYKHAYLTHTGWKFAQDLTTEDYLFVSKKKIDFPENSNYSDSEYSLVGWFLSEGCKLDTYEGNASSFFLSISETEYVEWIKNHLNPYDNTTWKSTESNTLYLALNTTGRNIGGTYIKNPAKLLITNLQLNNKYSYEKTIPSELLQSSNRQLALLLQAMFCGDGSVKKDRLAISYYTSSKRLAEQVVILLSRFGILSSISSNFDNRKDNYKDMYNVQILGEDVIKFAQAIPLVGRKQREIETAISIYASNSNTKARLPKACTPFIKKIITNSGLTPHSLNKLGLSLNYAWYRKNASFSIIDLKKILDVKHIPELQNILTLYDSEDFILSPIREIKKVEAREVYDISVNTKQFIAGSVIVHNTQGIDPINCQILLVSISWNGRNAVVFSPYFLWGKTDSTGVGRSYELWLEVLKTIPINNQNTKFDGKFILAKYKILINYLFCTLSCSQLGWPGVFPGDKFALDSIAKNLLKPIELSKELQTSFVGQPVEQEFTEDQVAYAASDTLITHRLYPKIKQRLINENLWPIWDEIESKCTSVLTKSEYKGILVDNESINTNYDVNLDKIYALEVALNEEYNKIPEEIRPIFPKDVFNPKSYKQILDITDSLGIKLSGTGIDILKEVRVQHPHRILDLLIEHKEIYTRYIKTIKKWIEECINPVTGCIHPTYYINGAWKTGRLSSSDPNTQNIPPELRNCFIARKNHKLITSDLSQFEFRACAGITKEQSLIDVFYKRAENLEEIKGLARKFNYIDPDSFVKDVRKGKVTNISKGESEFAVYFSTLDIHRMNASLIFGTKVEDVPDTARTIAKTLGYALLYGSGPGTILEQLYGEGITNIPIKDVIKHKETFFSQLSKVKSFIEKVNQDVINPGYIQNTIGRKRYFSLPPKYMVSRYNKELADAQREAVNWHFQSSNADALKMALLMSDEIFTAKYSEVYTFNPKMEYNNEVEESFYRLFGDVPISLLNVHDEMVSEAHEDIANEVADISVSCMVECGGKSIGYSCPIESSVIIADSWSK